ncbi:MAG: NUDIX domain-containing protein [Sulfurovum sp.]|nr:NUDIX domain-containing protein [Sulfurovum sp.]
MEANVKRILCRLHQLKNPTDKILWDSAYMMIDKSNPFDYNQAMMDIGSSICTPKNPLCSSCPLETICQGKKEPTLYPTKKKRKVPTREEPILLYIYNDRLSMKQRTGKFLHGLWGFESVEVPDCASEYIGEVTHAYTHFKLTCKVYVYFENTPKQTHYYTVEEIKKLAISKVDDKIIKLYLDILSSN